MKQYQDSDPLHGKGKATPKPKQPNSRPIGSRYTPGYKTEAGYGQCCATGHKS